MGPKGNKPTLGIREIAHALGCSVSTVRRRHGKGLLPTYQTGGKTSPIRARRVDLEKFIKRKGKR